MWQHAATKSRLLGASKITLRFQEKKGLCFGITEKIWWKSKGPSSFLVLMILLYEHNATGTDESANNVIIPAIDYLTYYKLSTTLGIFQYIFKSSGAISKIQDPVSQSVPIKSWRLLYFSNLQMFLIDHCSPFLASWNIQPLLGRWVTWGIQGSTTGRNMHSVLAVLTASNLLFQRLGATRITGCTILVHAQSVLGWDRRWEKCQLFPWALFC